MKTIELFLTDPTQTYRPGDTLHARARWRLERLPKVLEARLCWFTRGRGTTDVVIVATLPREPSLAGEWSFEMRIPRTAPPSYDGHLLSIGWSIEFVTGRKEFDSCDFVVSRTGHRLRPPRDDG